MKIAKALILSASLLFAHSHLQARDLSGEEAKQFKSKFVELVENYAGALNLAIDAQDLSLLEGQVEKDSPFYKIMEQSKKGKDFRRPSMSGGIPYYPAPHFLLRMIAMAYEEDAEKFEIKEIRKFHLIPQDLYDLYYKEAGGELHILIRYAEGHMKFYDVNTKPSLDHIFRQQLM